MTIRRSGLFLGTDIRRLRRPAPSDLSDQLAIHSASGATEGPTCPTCPMGQLARGRDYPHSLR